MEQINNIGRDGRAYVMSLLCLVLVFLSCHEIMAVKRHLLRVDLHVRQVNIQVDYIQPKSTEFPEKTCCTVTINNV